MCGDDVKLKQDREYEKSVEVEVMKRTAKEAEQQAEEAVKNRAVQHAVYSAALKQSEESAQRGMLVDIKRTALKYTLACQVPPIVTLFHVTPMHPFGIPFS